MKKFVGVLLAVLSAGSAWAGEMPGYTPPKPSAELEQVKALEGRWKGESTEKGQEGQTINVQYHVTSGGSAVQETLDPGTSHEMVSIYHDVNGKLSMTHYCMLGNQPELELKSAKDGKLVFEQSAASAETLKGQMAMGSLVLEHDKDTLTQTWTSYDAGGKSMQSTVFKLKKFDPAAAAVERRKKMAAAAAAAEKNAPKKEDKKEIKKDDKKKS